MILARTLSIAPTTDGKHCDLQLREEQDIIHTDAYAQNPLPFQRVSSLGKPWRRPYPWDPAALTWSSTDALFPSGYSFSFTVNPSNSPPTVDVYGVLPVNAPPPPTITAPVVPLQATTANTGGSILPGTYLVAISASVRNGPVSNFITVVVPAGTNTNMITISNVMWVAAATPSVYLGTSSLAMTQLFVTSWSGSSPDSSGNPTVFVITSPIANGIGLPDPNASSLLVQIKNIRHGGVWGDTVGPVAGSILTFGVPGSGWATNQWAGYTLSLYYRPGVNFQPGLNILVTSNTAVTLTMAAGGFLAGDVVVMRANSANISSNTIGDPNFVNAYGVAGLAVNAETGNLVRIIAGTGKGQPPMAIASNTASVLMIVGTWYITPDSTSKFIIETPSWIFTQTAAILNDGTAGTGAFGQIPIVSIPLPALTNYSLLIEGIIVDANGNLSVERYAPIREGYIRQIFTLILGEAFPVPVTGGIAQPDATKGLNLLTETADTFIATPVGIPSGSTILFWSLVIVQGTAGNSTSFDPSYLFSMAVTDADSLLSSRVTLNFSTDSTGSTTLLSMAAIK